MMDDMDDKTVVVLGGNILNAGIFDFCRNHGYRTVVVDWSPNASLKGDRFMCIDVKDHESIIQALESQGVRSICGAYSSIDLAVPSINMIHRHFGLEYMSGEAVVNAGSKAAMTKVWDEEGLLNRCSGVFGDLDSEVLEKSSAMKLIFKPNVSSSSRGITIVEKGAQQERIAEAFLKAKEESRDQQVVVEEFVEGREFTCDMLGDKNGNVSVYAISVKYHTANTSNNRIAVKLHYNSGAYPDEVYERIAEVGKKCYRSLGFKASFGHLEIIMKDDGTLSPVEIGARSSGYIANPLVALASGKDYLADYLNVVNGEAIEGKDFINGPRSSMYFFYDMPRNTKVKHPCSIMDYLPHGIVSVGHNRMKVMQAGFEFKDIANDNERIGFELLHGDKRLLTIDVIEKAEKRFIEHNTGKDEVL